MEQVSDTSNRSTGSRVEKVSRGSKPERKASKVKRRRRDTVEAGIDVVQHLRKFINEVNPIAINLFLNINKKRDNGNVLVSPLFLQTVVALTYTGNCEVSKQVSDFFQLPTNREEAIAAYLVLNQFLQQKDFYTSSSILVDNKWVLKEDFIHNCERFFNIDVKQFSFKTDAEDIKSFINTWIDSQTEGHIKNLLIDNILPYMESIELFTGVYFKTKWFKCIDDSHRERRKFYFKPNNFSWINMILIKDEIRTFRNEEIKADLFEIPCEGNSFSFIIILPDGEEQLKNLIHNMEATKLNLIEEFDKLYNVKPSLVEILIPEFRLSQTLDLKKVLISFGLNDLFDIKSSDFPEVSELPTFVKNVLLKCCIEIDSQGLECSAAIDLIDSESKSVCVDHPFLFLVIKNELLHDYLITFIGKFGYTIKDGGDDKCCDLCTCCGCGCDQNEQTEKQEGN